METKRQVSASSDESSDDLDFYDADDFKSFEDCLQIDMVKVMSGHTNSNIREEEEKEQVNMNKDDSGKKLNSNKRLSLVPQNSVENHENEVLKDEIRHLNATLLNRERSLPTGMK